MTASIAAVPPLTAAIYGQLSKDKEVELATISKEKELAIAQREQEFRMRTQLLDRAIDIDKPLQDRQQVLRYLVAVGSDESMKAWAKSELRDVEGELAALKADLTHAQTSKQQAEIARKVAEGAADAAKSREAAALAEVTRISSARAKSQAARDAAQEEARIARFARLNAERTADEARAELRVAEQRLREAASKATSSNSVVPNIPLSPAVRNKACADSVKVHLLFKVGFPVTGGSVSSKEAVKACVDGMPDLAAGEPSPHWRVKVPDPNSAYVYGCYCETS